MKTCSAVNIYCAYNLIYCQNGVMTRRKLIYINIATVLQNNRTYLTGRKDNNVKRNKTS